MLQHQLEADQRRLADIANTQGTQATSSGHRDTVSQDRELEVLIKQLATLSMNDDAIAPTPFYGKRMDPDEMEWWIDHFQEYT